MSGVARYAANLIDHSIVEQDCCVYCGNRKIFPKVFRNGATKHLDHFIPLEIIIRAKRNYPRMQLHNFLLPCCRTCNGYLGQLFFDTFQDKLDYMNDRKRRLLESDWLSAPPDWRQRRWEISDNPQYHQLLSIQAPASLTSIIKLSSTRGYIILCPQTRNGYWEISERVLDLAA